MKWSSNACSVLNIISNIMLLFLYDCKLYKCQRILMNFFHEYMIQRTLWFKLEKYLEVITVISYNYLETDVSVIIMGAVFYSIYVQKSQIHNPSPNSCGKACNHKNDDIHGSNVQHKRCSIIMEWWEQKHAYFWNEIICDTVSWSYCWKVERVLVIMTSTNNNAHPLRRTSTFLANIEKNELKRMPYA